MEFSFFFFFLLNSAEPHVFPCGSPKVHPASVLCIDDFLAGREPGYPLANSQSSLCNQLFRSYIPRFFMFHASSTAGLLSEF